MHPLPPFPPPTPSPFFALSSSSLSPIFLQPSHELRLLNSLFCLLLPFTQSSFFFSYLLYLSLSVVFPSFHFSPTISLISPFPLPSLASLRISTSSSSSSNPYPTFLPPHFFYLYLPFSFPPLPPGYCTCVYSLSYYFSLNNNISKIYLRVRVQNLSRLSTLQ